jgi:hypothetical protein
VKTQLLLENETLVELDQLVFVVLSGDNMEESHNLTTKVGELMHMSAHLPNRVAKQITKILSGIFGGRWNGT